MGYTHYWRRPLEIEQATFTKIADDFGRLILPLADHGIMLANGHGENEPVINSDIIAFNGLSKCGHPVNNEISIPWPTSEAGGVGSNKQAQDGTWYAGASLDTRCCDGDCSYESAIFQRVAERSNLDENGRFFDCCKTAFRPYDIAVTALLIIAKKHLGGAILVTSDGEDQHWFDAKMLCQSVLGYGLEFEMSSDGLVNTARPDQPSDWTAPKPEPKAVDPRPVRYLSAAETAKIVRKQLKAAYPAVKFSVTSKTYSGGASVNVSWFDGPATEAVKAIAERFEGADFDGMQDLKTYRGAVEVDGELVSFGADFIFCSREISYEKLFEAADRVCYELGAPMVEVVKSDYNGSGYIKGGDMAVNSRFHVYSTEPTPQSLDEAVAHIYGDSCQQHSLSQLITNVAHAIDYARRTSAKVAA